METKELQDHIEDTSPSKFKKAIIELCETGNYENLFSETGKDFILDSSDKSLLDYSELLLTDKYESLVDFTAKRYGNIESFTAFLRLIETAGIHNTIKSKEDAKDEADRLIEEQKNLKDYLLNSHVFEVSDKVKRAIILTKIEENIDKDILQLPYKITFINNDFTPKDFDDNSEVIYKGILIISDNCELINSRIITIGLDKDDIGLLNLKLDENLEFKDQKHKDFQFSKDLRDWIINFLYFLNTQKEVEWRQVKRNKSSQRNYERQRQKDNKPVIRNKIKIDLFGDMKKYVNNLQEIKDSHYSHRFWVRGHWRTLRDKDRYGDKTGLRIWIKPYLKGEGVVIKKDYKVNNNGVD